MSNTIKITKGDDEFVFEDVLAHQVGYGTAQVVHRNGNQHVINQFDVMTIEHDAEYCAKHLAEVEMAEAQAEFDAVEASATGESTTEVAVVS